MHQRSISGAACSCTRSAASCNGRKKKHRETSQARHLQMLVPALAPHWLLRTPTHNRCKASDNARSGHHHSEIACLEDKSILEAHEASVHGKKQSISTSRLIKACSNNDKSALLQSRDDQHTLKKWRWGRNGMGKQATGQQ